MHARAGLSLAVGVLLLSTSRLYAGSFGLDPAGSRLAFRAVAENAEFEGKFGRFASSASFDPARLETGRIEATVDIASVDTANGQRDELLVGSDWFDTAAFPQAKFVTRRIARAGDGYKADATLTIRNVSRPVVMEFRWQPEAAGAAARLKGSVRLKRLDFGLGQGDWRDTTYVADAVTVLIDVRYVASIPSPKARAAPPSVHTPGTKSAP